jgi:hypothetical protein
LSTEICRYDIGHEGTVLVTATSPTDVCICREGDLHEALMDGGIIMTRGRNFEKIPGHAKVIYSPDGTRVQVKL